MRVDYHASASYNTAGKDCGAYREAAGRCLTREFLDLRGERQVLRALRELSEKGRLIRLGYGVFARAEISPLAKQPILAGAEFVPVSRQMLILGVEVTSANVHDAAEFDAVLSVSWGPRVELWPFTSGTLMEGT